MIRIGFKFGFISIERIGNENIEMRENNRYDIV